MKLTCPACGAVASLDAIIAHRGARDAVQVALQMPAPLGELLVRYVALFRPKSRQLSLDRLARLLGELLPLIQAARIERRGREWPAPQEYWRSALEEITTRGQGLTLPLKSHGYLLEILAGYADKAAAGAEAKREQAQTQTPYRATQEAGRIDKQPREPMPEQAKDILRGLGMLRKKPETGGQP